MYIPPLDRMNGKLSYKKDTHTPYLWVWRLVSELLFFFFLWDHWKCIQDSGKECSGLNYPLPLILMLEKRKERKKYKQAFLYLKHCWGQSPTCLSGHLTTVRLSEVRSTSLTPHLGIHQLQPLSCLYSLFVHLVLSTPVPATIMALNHILATPG